MTSSERIHAMRRGVAAVAALAAVLAPVRAARAADPICPPQIAVEQRAIEPPSGYVPFDRKPPHKWVNAEFADGPPEEQAWLAPDSTQRKGATFINVWTFGQTGRGTYVSCAYANTSVELVMRLPDSIRRCEVRYAGPASAPEATALSCR